MTMPAVKKGVPIPGRGRGRGREARYPFAQMQIGTSFDMKPKKGETTKQLADRIRSAAATWRARANVNAGFVVREEDGLVRCWMTEYRSRFF